MGSSENTSGGQTVATVERAADMLRLFIDTDSDDLGVTEIARSLELSKAVVHRLLTSLRSKGFVTLNETTRRYQLGTTSLLLGLAAMERLDVRELALPEMEKLSAQTEETATLSIRTGRFRFYIDQITPSREVKMMVRIGHPWPLHAGASSKAFLAFMSDHEVEDYLADTPLEALTDATITNPGLLREELKIIQERGYATSTGERQVGAASIASPVFDHTGKVAAVISVCGPLERFKPIADHIVRLLLPAADSVSRKLGYQA